MNSSDYVLTEDDLSYWEDDDPPEIRAARNPNPRILIALLDSAPATLRRTYSANAFVPGHTARCLQTPLLAAIKAQIPENVRTLLSRGADPNGLSLDAMAVYAGDFLRFRHQCALISAPREELLKHISESQSEPFTVSEVEGRVTNICHFWSGADSIPLSYYKGGDGVTAVEEACKHESSEILDIVLSSSPDTSFWTGSETEIPVPATPSSLSVSNPLLCAIKHGQTHHIRRLLDLGFNPNSMPLACRQQCYSPLMATLMCCNPPNWDAFGLLLASPATNRNLLTPVTEVHILHVAAALLSTSIVKRVLDSGFTLPNTGPTALGHTFLHTACLPLDITHVNIFQESIYDSAHEFRQLPFGQMQNYIIFDADEAQPQPTDFFAAQAELVRYLLSKSSQVDALLAAQDCHGNTAIHYLVMHRTINHDLLDSLIAVLSKAEEIYYDVQNRWGWTAENLVRHGEVAEVDISKKFWRTSHAAKLMEGGHVVPYR